MTQLEKAFDTGKTSTMSGIGRISQTLIVFFAVTLPFTPPASVVAQQSTKTIVKQ